MYLFGDALFFYDFLKSFQFEVILIGLSVGIGERAKKTFSLLIVITLFMQIGYFSFFFQMGSFPFSGSSQIRFFPTEKKNHEIIIRSDVMPKIRFL